MISDERRARIESYGQAHIKLANALQQFPGEMWQFKPSPDDFSIHDIIVHIADSEASSYVRCRTFIAEPGSTVQAYDEVRWARALRYHDQSTAEALELFKWLRLRSYNLIKTLPESIWSNTIVHPENGVMTMEDWLDVYERHVPEHIAQMSAVYESWARRVD